MASNLKIGCIADDFTGAGDIASFFRKGGLNTAVLNGIPGDGMPLPEDIEALVIALKSRTQETKQAVSDSLMGFRYLASQGAKLLYFKYCSTFDSTPAGNIGPVVDAVMEEYDLKYTVLCPSLPVNGRTVRDGVLYVNGIPLAESHMKNHPLTPMWSSEIPELMRGQGKYPCIALKLKDMQRLESFQQTLDTLSVQNKRFYLCPDFWEDDHAELIAERFFGMKLFTGGSGLAEALAKQVARKTEKTVYAQKITGNRLLLAGSCSVATRTQVREYLNSGAYAVMLKPEEIGNPDECVQRLWKTIAPKLKTDDVLVYSSGSGGCAPGSEADASKLEQVLSGLSEYAVQGGIHKIVVAGGETSGAVMQKLGYRMFRIGENISAGVPIMYPIENRGVAVVLKSGNFGDDQFLLRVLT